MAPEGPVLSGLEGVLHGNERETVKVGVACHDSAHTVLAHEYGRVEIVHEVAASVGDLSQGLLDQIPVPPRGFVSRRWPGTKALLLSPTAASRVSRGPSPAHPKRPSGDPG